MTHKFYQTNNVKWYPVSPPPGKKGSERLTLYSLIEEQPGRSSDELQERWPFRSSMRSRLQELHAAKYIRSEEATPGLFSEDAGGPRSPMVKAMVDSAVRGYCPHGKRLGECSDCDAAGDFAYDSWRERR